MITCFKALWTSDWDEQAHDHKVLDTQRESTDVTHPAQNYSPSGEGYWVSYADYEMIRGGATRIHHLSLLKAQRGRIHFSGEKGEEDISYG